MTTLISEYGKHDQKGTVLGIFRSIGALARAIGPIFASIGNFFCSLVNNEINYSKKKFKKKKVSTFNSTRNTEFTWQCVEYKGAE